MTAPWRRRALLALGTHPATEAAVHAIGPLERAAWRRGRAYVAGPTARDALARATALGAGYATSIDYFGESVTDAAEADAAAATYVELAGAALPPGAKLALDLSHLGLDADVGACRARLARIVEALPAGRSIQLGAEDRTRTDATQSIARELATAGAPLELTLQANLRRSAQDWPGLVEAGLPLRLVKGAYVEPPAVALRYGPDVDAAYAALARDVHGAGARLSLATHDPELRDGLLAELGAVEVEMLLGVRGPDAAALRDRGVAVRLYVPWGEGWLRYVMRRHAEAQGA